MANSQLSIGWRAFFSHFFFSPIVVQVLVLCIATQGMTVAVFQAMHAGLLS